MVFSSSDLTLPPAFRLVTRVKIAGAGCGRFWVVFFIIGNTTEIIETFFGFLKARPAIRTGGGAIRL
ncbi:MAG: hypothetical protein SWZ49_05140, partial [Cyanobacteriota bacterium]|nr:hypothetical protein [Cyanobacteriota bacterium]